ncbi:hypothetical protein HK405_000230, partial [Cladochytrium tenue]
HSIKTFSWLQGNKYPGYAVLTLVPPDASIASRAYALEKCALPPQLHIYKWYAALGVLTVLYCLGSAIFQTFRPSRGAHSRGRSNQARPLLDADDRRRTTHSSGGGGVANSRGGVVAARVLAVLSGASLKLGEVVVVTLAAHATLVAWDWLV